MSLTGIALRRIRPHLATWLAVLASVHVTVTTIGSLILLSSAIGDASTRGLVAAAEPSARSISVTASVPAGGLSDADEAVRAVLAPLLPRSDLTIVATTTSRGIEGQPENTRALLAEVHQPGTHADLVAGEWPAPVGSPDDPVTPLPVALHEAAAQMLGVGVGDSINLVDLIKGDEPPRAATIVATYLPKDATDAVWAELPIVEQGTATTEFESYGPFLLGAGAFDQGVAGTATVTWRVSPHVTDIDAAGVPVLAGQVGQAIDAARAAAARDDPRSLAALRGARVGSELPELLTEAGQLATRAQAALLTPTFLLILLGGTALAVSVALLALLREPETRLLRTRGAGTRQVGLLALVEGGIIVAVAFVGGVLLAPALATTVARWADLGTEEVTLRAALRSPVLLAGLTALAVLALLTIVATSVLRSRDLVRGDRRTGLATTLASAGLDIVLLALGLLAFLQLRRYLEDSTPALDPLTAAAPGLLVAALAVASLRVLPLLTRLAGRLTTDRSLPLAWGGWQLARRIGSQAGALLLVLLAVPVSVLAVAQQSTTEAAIVDQSRFTVGADLRVEPRPDTLRAPDLVSRLATYAGGRDRVMPTTRETVTVGSLDRVTLLGVDAQTAGTVAQPRPDLLPGADWQVLMDRLAGARPETSTTIGVPLPDEALSVTLILEMGLRETEDFWPPGEAPPAGGALLVVVTDAVGATWPTSFGHVSSGQPVEITLPADLPRPLSVTAVQVGTNLTWIQDEQGSIFSLAVDRVVADRTELPVDSLGSAIVRNGRATLAPTRPDVPTPPVLLTSAVADDLQVEVGDQIALAFRGQSLDVEVAALIDQLPTGVVPERGVLADLATLNAAALTGAQAAHQEGMLLGAAPREYWLAPTDVDATLAALAQDRAAAATVLDARAVAAERRAGPVHAGMRAALLLVSVTATILAALGFAAATAAIGRTRRHEGAVLHALGLPPREIRRTALIERWAVIVLAVLAGVVIGGAITFAVVPLLVGGDGHQHVPDVRTVVPWGSVGLVAALTAAALAAGTLVAARQATAGLVSSLREGED